MAPLRRIASMALGVAAACCMPAAVRAQEDTPAPVLISGFDNADSGGDALAPVFLPGVGFDENDADSAAGPDPAEEENVLLASGSGADGSISDAPIFLPGVFLDGSDAGTPAPAASAPAATTPAPVLLADGDGSATDTPATTAPAVGAGDMVLGGWPSMPVGDAEIAFLLSALRDAKLYNPALSFGVCMKDIFKLEYQGVAGTNYRYSGHGCLVHKGSTSMGACTVECAVEQLQVTIYTKEWTNTVEVTGIARLQMTA